MSDEVERLVELRRERNRERSARIAAEREQLARLHEVATERVVQLAAVIEQAKLWRFSPSGRTWSALEALLESAETGAALRDVRAQAWDEGHQMVCEDVDYVCDRIHPNPYRVEADRG